MVHQGLRRATVPLPSIQRCNVSAAGRISVKPSTSFSTKGAWEQVLFYRIKGGSFGDGLSGNIRRAYKFLSFYYEPGDQIFVFGFSRGAYTARSLVGYIGSAGLLTRGNCTPVLEQKAWDYYRTDPNDRMPGIWAELTPLVHDRGAFRIACLGVFDTVGALGVPLPQFYRLNRESYEFHNVELSSITNVNLHALAVDEHRQPFAPTVWRKPKFKSFATTTEQVWFAGSHADVGGGYIEEVRRAETNIKALDDITLDWMLKRVAHHFDGFPFNEQVWKLLDSSWSSAPQHPSRTGFYKLMPLALRAIANRSLAALGWREKIVGYDRHAESIGEMIHISVLERLGLWLTGKMPTRRTV